MCVAVTRFDFVVELVSLSSSSIWITVGWWVGGWVGGWIDGLLAVFSC